MKLVMTILVRDEADVVDASIAYHLNAGVDLVIATDNRSSDGTTEILESYAREGVLHLIREPGTAFLANDWVTRMSRLAAREFAADWVINSDADEFWWPRGESLKSVLELIPERYGVVRGLWTHFVPRPGEEFFAERMTMRVRSREAVTNPVSPYVSEAKFGHRADPEVISHGKGVYTAAKRRLLPMRGWYPVEVLHFPLRSPEQCLRKYRNLAGSRAEAGLPVTPLQEFALRGEAADGGAQDHYAGQLVDDATAARGIEEGWLVVDTRVRDALRSLQVDSGPRRFALPVEGQSRLRFGRPDLADEMSFAIDAALLDDADIIRFQARLDRLEAELASLRLTRGAKLRWKLARIARRR